MAQAEDPKWSASDTGRVRDRKNSGEAFVVTRTFPPFIIRIVGCPPGDSGSAPDRDATARQDP